CHRPAGVDLGQVLETLRYVVRRRRVERRQCDEGREGQPDLLEVDLGAVAGDDSALLQTLHALVHCGRRQADSSAQVGKAHAAVCGEQSDNLAVNGFHDRLAWCSMTTDQRLLLLDTARVCFSA